MAGASGGESEKRIAATDPQRLAPVRSDQCEKPHSVVAYADWQGQLAPVHDAGDDLHPTLDTEVQKQESIWSTRLDNKTGPRWAWALFLRLLRLPNGTMSWLDFWLSQQFDAAKERRRRGGLVNHLLYWAVFGMIFLDACLRSAGSTCSCNNPVTGMFVWAASFSFNRWHTSVTIMAVVLANATAFWLGIRHKPIRSGVFGSPAYIMAGLSSRLINTADEWNWRIVLLIAFASPVVVALNLSLGNFLIPNFRLPPLAIPALSVVWVNLNMIYFSPNISNAPYQTTYPTMSATQPVQNAGPSATFVDGGLMVRGIFVGIGAVSVMSEVRCGALVLAGIFCFSRISAINCVWATTVSTLVAVTIGASSVEIGNGQYSFQAATVAMALCGNFYVVTATSFINALFAVVFEVLLNVLIRTTWNLIGINPTGLPATLVIWLFLGMQGSIRGAPPVALTEISTPERHLKLHWLRKKDRHGTSSLFIRNTGLDPAKLI